MHNGIPPAKSRSRKIRWMTRTYIYVPEQAGSRFFDVYIRPRAVYRLEAYSIKSHQQSSLPYKVLVQNKFSMTFNKPTGRGNMLNFIQINCQISKKMDTGVFDVSYNCDLKWESGSSTDIKMWSLVVSIIHLWKKSLCKYLNTSQH